MDPVQLGLQNPKPLLAVAGLFVAYMITYQILANNKNNSRRGRSRDAFDMDLPLRNLSTW